MSIFHSAGLNGFALITQFLHRNRTTRFSVIWEIFGSGFHRTVETEIVGIWSSKTCFECFTRVSSLLLLSSLNF